MKFDLRTTEQLDELPNQAVVYDTSCQVWQKLSHRDRHNAGLVWFKPGDSDNYYAWEIELPACLLDDGL